MSEATAEAEMLEELAAACAALTAEQQDTLTDLLLARVANWGVTPRTNHVAKMRACIERLEATLKETRDACSVIDDEWDDRSGDGSARLLLRDIAKGEYP